MLTIPILDDSRTINQTEWVKMDTSWAFISKKAGICCQVIMVYNTFGLAGAMAMQARNPEHQALIQTIITDLDLADAPARGTVAVPSGYTKRPTFVNGTMIPGSFEPNWSLT